MARRRPPILTSPDKKHQRMYRDIYQMWEEIVIPEYGEFTPVVSGTSTAGTGTYTTRDGYYEKIAGLLHFKTRMTWTAHTGTGNMIITGLPYTSANIGFVPVSIVPSAITTPANSVVSAMVVGNSGQINIYSVLTSGTATLAALAMDTAGSFWVSGSYRIQS